MTTNTNHAFASTNRTRIDLREDPSREAETSDSPSASLLSIQNIMARNEEKCCCRIGYSCYSTDRHNHNMKFLLREGLKQ